MTTELGSPVYEIFSGDTISIPEAVETGISGTFNGMSISMPDLAPGPNGTTAWLLLTQNLAVPMGTEFAAGGDTYEILYDVGIQIFDLTAEARQNSPIDGEQVGWSAVEVPEPAAVWLLLIAVSSLGLMKWAQMSLRKLSRR